MADLSNLKITEGHTDPSDSKRNILITSALPYVNNVPHLGNLIGCVLSADVFARYSRLRGHNVMFVCGTDEYGTATETKAMEENCTPKEVCDKYHQIHKEVYQWFGCSFDHFGRTTTQQQTEIVQDIFNKLHQNGYIFVDKMEQLYCSGCESFLADRYVGGTCPHCQYNDARGDQCDVCGKLLNPTELKDPKCNRCKKKQPRPPPPTVRETSHLFLDLPKMKPKLEEWVDKAVNPLWSSNSEQITRSWVKDLKPRCITRDLKWGVPVPLEGFTNKVFYVWFDAPIGYISITAHVEQNYKRWWQNPNKVELYQFMGKDNIPFHTVIFPSSLLGTGEPYTMLRAISTTEYLNYEGTKFSKSRNIGVFGTDTMNTGIPAEMWRFYLLSIRPETGDSSFQWDDFAAKINDELLANLGNFVNRALKFLVSNFNGAIPHIHEVTEAETTLVTKVEQQLAEYIKALDALLLREGLKIVLAISQLGNQYFQANQPWDLIKKDKARCETVSAVGANLSLLLATLLEPYTPSLSEKIFRQLNTKDVAITGKFDIRHLPEGHKLGAVDPLIQKISPEKLAKLKEQFPVPAVFPLDLRVGHVLSVEDHPQADNLFVCQVDVGSEKRQIVAGLKGIYPKEELQGRQVVVICNLKPVALKGVTSAGMLICAEHTPAAAAATTSGAAATTTTTTATTTTATATTTTTAAAAKPTLILLEVSGQQAPGTPVIPLDEAVGTKAEAVLDKKEFTKVVMSTGADGGLVFCVKKAKIALGTASDRKPVFAKGVAAGAKIK
eukprot:TRINITY_DN3204_c0_g1_i1.p1 TRINITY_DN3204_c0_g1~~TRINITY_DN3204_c0_g1_i1.p1  ORF type:complete len:780 (+),score=309.97 TRINITY_DN3204_c0_g1_i1:135-2474(+)